MERSDGCRELLLLRHAKSDWSSTSGGDHDRPLARRGREAAPRMGRFLAAVGPLPGRVVTSSAVRARSTAELAVEAGNWRCPIQVAPELYEASVEDLLDLVARQPADLETLLLVGHEPTLSQSIGVLVGGASVRFPTAALASIRCAVRSWQAVAPGTGTLAWLVTPKLVARSAR